MDEIYNFDLIAQGFHMSCGVELEFMSRIPKPPGSTKYFPYEFVTDLLNEGELEFKFNDLSGAEKFDYDHTWTITLDETLKPEPSDPRAVPGQLNSIVTGMELVSPVLSFDHNRWPNKDILYVCSQLAPAETQDYHCWINKSCGLHVHVRVLQSPNPDLEVDNLEFLAIQNVIAVWGVYEKEIEKFHPDYRRAPNNRYAASLRSKVPYLPGDPAASAADWLKHVYACKDFNDLRNLVQNDTGVGDARDSKINIVAYSPRDSDKPRPDRGPTIEFREHVGSLDPFEISFWTAFVSKMVLFGVWLAKSGFTFDIEDAGKCSTGDLLEGLRIFGGMRSHYILKTEDEAFNDLFVALRKSAAGFKKLPQNRSHQIFYEFEEAKKALAGGERFLLALAKKVNTGLGLPQASDSVIESRLLYYMHIYRYSPETTEFIHQGLLMAWATQM